MADKMDKKELKQIREKMKKAVETYFRGRNHPDKTRCPSLKKMAEYINQVFPTLEAEITSWSERKGRKVGRIFISLKTYRGNKLYIRDKKTREVIKEHSSTETYRANTDVAEFIFQVLEKDENLTQLNIVGEE